LNVEIGGVDFEDCFARIDGEIDERVDKFMQVHINIRTRTRARSIEQ
jgi:hypothetical protein